MIYFDHNATSPLSPQARQAWIEASETFIGNPSSPHRLGSRAEAALAGARHQLASRLGCNPPDIVWTSGATESNNTVLAHFANTPDGSAQAWISAVEHPSVIQPANRHFAGRIQWIPATRDGVVDLNWLAENLGRMRPGLVAIMAANNETGVLQPWRQALKLCRQSGVPFFCDATQWIGKLPAAGLGQSDFVSGSAHKFGGPRGIGFLKCPAGTLTEPLLRGGRQEDERRAGTENVPGVLGMMAALELRETALAGAEHHPRMEWRKAFEHRLRREIEGVRILGADVGRLWNTVPVIMPETDCRHRWVVKLDKLGCAVSTGSACASGREEPSHVLRAMAIGPDAAGRALRFSSGWETDSGQWDKLAEILATVYLRLR